LLVYPFNDATLCQLRINNPARDNQAIYGGMIIYRGFRGKLQSCAGPYGLPRFAYRKDVKQRYLAPMNPGGTGEDFIRPGKIEDFNIIKNIDPDLYRHRLTPSIVRRSRKNRYRANEYQRQAKTGHPNRAPARSFNSRYYYPSGLNVANTN
jgi:hypothetical protein